MTPPIEIPTSAFDLATADSINEEIWSESPRIQADVQAPRGAWDVGDVGAQQAMCGSPPIPWVPDLVGVDFHRPGSVLVVGMAYSGFVRRPNRNHGEIPWATYAACPSASAFCKRFLRAVVPVYPYYTNVLDALPEEVRHRRVAFTDLCRVALVKVGPHRDSSSGIERADTALFSRYADHPVNRDWHARRLLSSGARVVVALGHVAEHGVLRLMRDVLQCTVRASSNPSVSYERESGPETWAKTYAHDGRKVGHWQETRDWWRAEGPRGRWNVVTIPHPSESTVAPVHVERIRRAWEELGQSKADLTAQTPPDHDAPTCQDAP